MSWFKLKNKKSAAPKTGPDTEAKDAFGPRAQPEVKPTNKTRSFQNPKILEVNLIKDEERVGFDWSRNFLFLGLVIVLAGLLVAEVYFGLDWWAEQEEARLAPLIAEVDRLNAATAKLNNEVAAALSYKDKAAAFSVLLDEHVYWSQFFSWLEKNTLNTVKYEEFSGNLSGLYTLKAVAPSLSEVSWQASAFLKDPAVEQVAIREAGLEGGEELNAADQFSFDIMLKVKRDIFKK